MVFFVVVASIFTFTVVIFAVVIRVVVLGYKYEALKKRGCGKKDKEAKR